MFSVLDFYSTNKEISSLKELVEKATIENVELESFIEEQLDFLNSKYDKKSALQDKEERLKSSFYELQKELEILNNQNKKLKGR